VTTVGKVSILKHQQTSDAVFDCDVDLYNSTTLSRSTTIKYVSPVPTYYAAIHLELCNPKPNPELLTLQLKIATWVNPVVVVVA